MRWTVIWLAILALILTPFFLFERQFAELAARVAAGTFTGWVAGFVIAGLLAADLALPVPSSVLSTAAGALFGFWAGLATSWIGMTAGAWLGYVAGQRVGRPAAGRFVGAEALDRVTRFAEKHGDWVIIAARPVPVLAEASVVFAGMAGMRGGRFALLTSCANLGIAAAYAGVGAYAVSVGSFLLAFAGSIAVPLTAMGLARLTRL
jgi:uncharacterized membrane protein YdjX (TVP38/TMEM64 family)